MVELDIWAGIPTLTIPATKAPQLNAPMSFGTEMNLIKQKDARFETCSGRRTL